MISRGTVNSQLYVWDIDTLSWIAWDGAGGVAGPGGGGDASAANQVLGNASLSSIDTKTPALVSGRQPVDGSGVTQPVSGPLTDTQLRATPVPVSGTVTATTGGLTDTQLRASAVPVSLAAAPTTPVTNAGLTNLDVLLSTRTKPADQQHTIVDSITAGATVIGKVGIDQTTPGTTNKVDIGTNGTVAITNLDVALSTRLKPADTLTAVTSITNVVHVDDNTGSLTVDAPVGTPVFVKLSDGAASLVGQKAMTASLPVVIASDQTAVAVTAAQGTATNLKAQAENYQGGTAVGSGNPLQVTLANTGANATAVSVAGPTLTKGTQGSTGFSTQDLKDAGRTSLIFSATAAASGTTGTETAISLNKAAGTGATSSAASFVVTSGKRFRITQILVSAVGHATGTTQATTFNLRVNTAGAVITSSTPIVWRGRVQTPATSLAYQQISLTIPDGYEILGDGTLQFGLTANAVFTTNAPTWDATIVGFEY